MNSPNPRDARETTREDARPSRDASEPIRVPAQIKFVCESADGKLCLFEDAQGHFTVVRTARLA